MRILERVEVYCENTIRHCLQSLDGKELLRQCLKCSKSKNGNFEEIFQEFFASKVKIDGELYIQGGAGFLNKNPKLCKSRLKFDGDHIPKKITNANCAKPDVLILRQSDNAILCDIELKVLRVGNDYDLFNGVTQMREYMQLYKIETGLLIVFTYFDNPTGAAIEFLRKLVGQTCIHVMWVTIVDNIKINVVLK